jgi:hypothetical protein
MKDTRQWEKLIWIFSPHKDNTCPINNKTVQNRSCIDKRNAWSQKSDRRKTRFRTGTLQMLRTVLWN